MSLFSFLLYIHITYLIFLGFPAVYAKFQEFVLSGLNSVLVLDSKIFKHKEPFIFRNHFLSI